MQEYQLYCANSDCELFSIAVEHGKDFFFKPDLQGQAILSILTACHNCGLVLSIRFIKTPPYLLIQPLYRHINSDLEKMFFDNIPKTIKLDNAEFHLLCCTTHKGSKSKSTIITDHYCTIYELEKRRFYIDDLITPEYTEHIPNIHKVATCFYYLK